MANLNEKKVSIKIVVATIVGLALIAALSFTNEKNTQKLPGAVKAESIEISSRVDGYLKNIFVAQNEFVEKGQLLLELENKNLMTQIENLNREKEQLEYLIKSASGGHQLDLKLMKLDENIREVQSKLNEAAMKISALKNEISILDAKQNLANKDFIASQKLFKKSIISSAEFNEKMSDFEIVNNHFLDATNELNFIQTEKTNFEAELKNLQTQKKLFSENVSLIVADYLLDLEKIKSNLNELGNDVNELKVYAKASGYIAEVNIRFGEWINAGKAIIKIVNLENLWIVAYGSAIDNKLLKKGMKTKVFCSNGEEVNGKLASISPTMDRVKSLAGSFETVHSYTKIIVEFDDAKEAAKNLTPGEKLVVQIFKK